MHYRNPIRSLRYRSARKIEKSNSVNLARAVRLEHVMQTASVEQARESERLQRVFAADSGHGACRGEELRRSLLAVRRAAELVESGTLTPLSGDRLSDRLTILGSGPSVNNLTKDDWVRIDQGDTWGFNFWLVHPYVPDVLFVQTAPRLQGLSRELFRTHEERYRDVTLVIRGDWVFRKPIATQPALLSDLLGRNHRVEVLPELMLTDRCTVGVDQVLSNLSSLGYFDDYVWPRPVPKIRATIPLLIALGIILGYREIVLAGIDMLDGTHFYDSEEFFAGSQVRELSRRTSNVQAHPHLVHSDVVGAISALDRLQRQVNAGKVLLGARPSALEGIIDVVDGGERRES